MDLYGVKIPKMISKKMYNDIILNIKENKRKQVSKIIQYDDKLRAIFGEMLVLTVLSELLKIDYNEITRVKGNCGKPYLMEYDDVHYNISHSGNWVVMVVDNEPVGIDIEEIKPFDLRIAKRFFSDMENSFLDEVEGMKKLDYFFDLWTLKESFLKKVGFGLTLPLNSFSIIKEDENSIRLSGNYDSKNFFRQYFIDKYYKFSVCASNCSFPKKVFIIDYTSLIRAFMK